ncbi:hypothetical protein G6F23_012321 [Rhizopus arrhizus]|nr:hypothetical protein G6F23_012321 [Rhizopus arrhizus]
MYVATDDLVLAFFHQQEKGSTCGVNSMDDIQHNLLQSFKNYCLNNKTAPQRILQVINNQTKSVIFSWPDHYPHEILDDRPAVSPGVVSCFRCVQQPSRITQDNVYLQSLYIDYGHISFIITLIVKKRPVAVDGYKIPNNKTNRYSIKHSNQEEDHQYKCQSCGTQSSPEWRRGPSGHKTLCNACGLRYSRSMARQEKMAQQRLPNSPQPSSSSSTSSTSSLSNSFLELPQFFCKYSPY